MVFDLTLEEVNVILMALDQRPHGQVRPLIDKIVKTANVQLQPPSEGKADAGKKDIPEE